MSKETSAERLAALGSELETARSQLASAHRELQTRVAQLVMLYRIGRDLSNHSNWDEALQRFLHSLREFLGAEGVGLFLTSDGGRVVRARRMEGLTPALVESACARLQEGSLPSGDEPYLLPLRELGAAHPVPCVDQLEPWRETVLPLRHRDRDLGYLLLVKEYEAGLDMAEDIYFLITVQTILTEEVAGAQAVTELRKLQRFQQRTLDEVASGIVTFDERGKRLYANRKGQELLGDDASPSVRMGGEVVKLATWAIQAVKGVPMVGEAWVRLDAAESIPVSLRAARMAAEMPGQSHFLVILDDQRASRALEIERRRVARQQEHLIMAAEWAHDVRTPLTGILHSAELLANAVPEDSPKRRHFEVVRSEVERINTLVSHFLDFARPVMLKRDRLVLAKLGQSLVELMEPVAKERGISLRLRVDVEHTVLVADVDQLRQVLLNLVSNALDASPENGEVLLHFFEADPPAEILAQRPVQRVAVLEIIDDGEGVPTDQIERLFVPFFTTKSDGTGLGLAIAEKLIRAHQGHLRYLRREGRTVLRAVIPLAATEQGEEPGDAQLEARG